MSPPSLRIHVITEEDPFYLPVFFREFFALLPRDHFTVTGVDITPPLNQKSRRGLARKLYRFYGAVDFLRLGVRFTARKLLDLILPSGWWRGGTIRRIALAQGVPCRTVSDVNAPEYLERLRGYQLDLLISVAASQVFRKGLLALPRLAAINIHTGSLPRYRGMLPVFWQLFDRCDTIGITIHTMTVELDLGQIVLSRQVAISGARNLDRVIREMKREGARAMIEALERYRQGTVAPVAMELSEAGYRSFPGRDDARAFRRMGGRLL